MILAFILPVSGRVHKGGLDADKEKKALLDIRTGGRKWWTWTEN